MNYYYITQQSQPAGPISQKQLLEMVKSGAIQPHTFIGPDPKGPFLPLEQFTANRKEKRFALSDQGRTTGPHSIADLETAQKAGQISKEAKVSDATNSWLPFGMFAGGAAAGALGAYLVNHFGSGSEAALEHISSNLVAIDFDLLLIDFDGDGIADAAFGVMNVTEIPVSGEEPGLIAEAGEFIRDIFT